MDELVDRYRNLSGTILVINDLNYLEIGINEVIDLSLFSKDFLNKSRGLREHIALNNLVPDASNVEAKKIDENTFNSNKKFDNDFIKEIALEVSKRLNEKPVVDLDMIKTIASEIGKELAGNIPEVKKDDEQSIKNNEYEQNILNSNIDNMQRAIDRKYAEETKQKPPVASEEKFEDIDDNFEDLKNMINKTGGK